jgi:hypothetical protein
VVGYYVLWLLAVKTVGESNTNSGEKAFWV